MNDDQNNRGPKIIDPSAIVGPRPEKKIRIEWRGNRPHLDDLTGADARRALAEVLVQLRDLQRSADAAEVMRASVSSLLVALVHRECARGLCDAQGKPIVPMVAIIPPESAAVGLERWRFQADQGPDGSVRIVVDRGPEPAGATPGIIS